MSDSTPHQRPLSSVSAFSKTSDVMSLFAATPAATVSSSLTSTTIATASQDLSSLNSRASSSNTVETSSAQGMTISPASIESTLGSATTPPVSIPTPARESEQTEKTLATHSDPASLQHAESGATATVDDSAEKNATADSISNDTNISATTNVGNKDAAAPASLAGNETKPKVAPQENNGGSSQREAIPTSTAATAAGVAPYDGRPPRRPSDKRSQQQASSPPSSEHSHVPSLILAILKIFTSCFSSSSSSPETPHSTTAADRASPRSAALRKQSLATSSSLVPSSPPPPNLAPLQPSTSKKLSLRSLQEYYPSRKRFVPRWNPESLFLQDPYFQFYDKQAVINGSGYYSSLINNTTNNNDNRIQQTTTTQSQPSIMTNTNTPNTTLASDETRHRNASLPPASAPRTITRMVGDVKMEIPLPVPVSTPPGPSRSHHRLKIHGLNLHLHSHTTTNNDSDGIWDPFASDSEDSDADDDDDPDADNNIGYREWKRRRREWTRNCENVEPLKSTLDDVPEASYPTLYNMLVKQSRPLKKPLPLADALVIIKAGWVATGQWPPPNN